MEQEVFLTEYTEFLQRYRRGSVAPEDIGEIIARMAQYYAEKNLACSVASGKYSDVAAEHAGSIDEQTGKAISIAKADILTRATAESKEYEKIKRDLQSLEQIINALKSLQKGVLNEYSHFGGT